MQNMWRQIRSYGDTMKIDNTKSVLNQKCECGEKIDYFSLRKKYLMEVQYKVNLAVKAMLIIDIFVTLIWAPDIIKDYIQLQSLQPENAFGLGMLFVLWIINIAAIVPSYNSGKKYDVQKARKKHVSRMRHRQKIKGLSKRQKSVWYKAIGFMATYLICTFAAPAYGFLFIAIIYIFPQFEGNASVVPIIILVAFFVLFVFYSKSSLMEKQKKWVEKKIVNYLKANGFTDPYFIGE